MRVLVISTAIGRSSTQMGEHRERELVGDAVGRVAQHAQRLARSGKWWIIGRCGWLRTAGAGSTPRRPTAAPASHR